MSLKILKLLFSNSQMIKYYLFSPLASLFVFVPLCRGMDSLPDLRDECSLYVYKHNVEPSLLKQQLEKSALRPKYLIHAIAGFGKAKEPHSFCPEQGKELPTFSDIKKAFPNYKHIGLFEGEDYKTALTKSEAQSAFNAIIHSLSYNNKSVCAFSLDCEPFYTDKVNNISFHTELVKQLNENNSLPVSVYVNPGHLVDANKNSSEELNLFLEQISKQNYILMPAYSYDGDCVNPENINAAISILRKTKTDYQLILDTKQSENLEPRIDYLKGIKSDLSKIAIFSLENNPKNYGDIEQQKENFDKSMQILANLSSKKQSDTKILKEKPKLSSPKKPKNTELPKGFFSPTKDGKYIKVSEKLTNQNIDDFIKKIDNKYSSSIHYIELNDGGEPEAIQKLRKASTKWIGIKKDNQWLSK